MSIDQIRKMSARIEKEKSAKKVVKEGDYTDAEKMLHQKNKESLQDKQLKDKNRAVAKRENEREMLRKKATEQPK